MQARLKRSRNARTSLEKGTRGPSNCLAILGACLRHSLPRGWLQVRVRKKSQMLVSRIEGSWSRNKSRRQATRETSNGQRLGHDHSRCLPSESSSSLRSRSYLFLWYFVSHRARRRRYSRPPSPLGRFSWIRFRLGSHFCTCDLVGTGRVAPPHY